MKRVLIIDDDPEIVQTMTSVLASKGFEIVIAKDGKQGLRRFIETAPDLVVIDIFMPEREGLETIMEIRKRSASARIIAISGGASASKQDFLPAAQQLGADAALAKPFSEQALLHALTPARAHGKP